MPDRRPDERRAERRPHPPSQARALVQAAKAGDRPILLLLGEAAAIEDPSFGSEALMALSTDPRLTTPQAAQALDESLRLLRATERDWRRAEVIAHAAPRLTKWRSTDPHSIPAIVRFHAGLLDVALALPPGPAASQAVQALAPVTPPELRAKLLRKALANPEPLADAKAVLAEGPAPGLAEAIANVADQELKARLLGAWHARGGGTLAAALDAAKGLAPATLVDIVRALVAATESLADVQEVARRAPPAAEPAARILTACAARADRLGDADAARSLFDRAAQEAAKVEDAKARTSIERNIESGRARIGMDPGKAKASLSPTPEPAAPAVPKPPANLSGRHILALVDTYEGKVGDVHLRAIARAAPLCAGFDLDLGLVGFPTKGVADLVRVAARETNIGGGKGYLDQLADEGRVHLIPWSRDEPVDLRPYGMPVATMSDPDEGKAVDFSGAVEKARAAGSGRLLVLMGLGKNGLPVLLRRFAPCHLELTGKGISMETATAMGVLAERMRQLPQL